MAKLDIKHFKPVTAVRTGISDDQISVNSVGLSFSQKNADRLGKMVNLLWSEHDTAVAIQSAPTGGAYTVRKASDRSKSVYVFARPLIKSKKIKLGRYQANWDQGNKMLVAIVETEDRQ